MTSTNRRRSSTVGSIAGPLLLAAVLCTMIDNCGSFNVDIDNYVRTEGPQASMFGFSVALHREAQRSWAIVGAPNAERGIHNDPIRRGGAVYRCDISDDNRCSILHFDTAANQRNERNEEVDTKSNQWFGATVASAGVDGPIVACAPRYVFHTMKPTNTERVEPVGTCYVAKPQPGDRYEFTEYSPCRTMYWGYHRQGFCQAGMSAAITKDGKRLFVGAPGSWYWQGQSYSIHTDKAFPFKPPRFGQFGEGGQAYSSSVSSLTEKVYETRESGASEDDSYLGYSSAAGDFNGDGLAGVAVGMPRGGGLLGKVVIFSWNMTNQQNITGEQIGAYFGYALCVVDVDGDKLDDLIIGAPMYTEPNNEGKYEMGRVYIMYQEKYNKFQELDTRDGTNSRARFGLSLASLGDMNGDGFGDFAVGAPYDGPKGRGAVYIYHGSPTGPLAKASQVIFAEQVIGTPLTTFGFSVAGGIDLDGNLYPDMVVGAYGANRAIVFMARPVASIEATTTFETDSKLVSLDDKNCKLTRDQKSVTCAVVNSCLKYTGTNLPATIDVDVSWVLDAKKQRNPRLFFVSDEGKNVKNSTIRLQRGRSECRREQVYITDVVRDKLTPLEVEMKYNLANERASRRPVVRQRRAALEPVIDHNMGTVQRDQLNIQKNCGPDNVCIPDMRLEIKTVDKYLFGSKDLLSLEVLVSNFGEDAFEAGFYMNVPPGLDYKRIERIGDQQQITCTALSNQNTNNNTLKCDIGNPLAAGKVANFKVIMSPAQRMGMAPSYDFYMEANSTNAEADGTQSDNAFSKSIGIWVETDLSITGTSMPPSIHSNSSQYSNLANVTSETELGPQVVHIYNIRNNGPSLIERSQVFVIWPYETSDGRPLMYLLNQPETSGNIECSPTIYANERGFKLDPTLSRRSYLEIAGAIVKPNYATSRLYGAGGSSGSGSTISGSGGGFHSGSGSGHHGVVVEQGSSRTHQSGGGRWSSSSSSGSANRERVLTEEDMRRLDAEERIESTGDASLSHRQRGSLSFGGMDGNMRTHNESYFQQGGSGSGGRGAGSTVVMARNRTIVRGSDGRILSFSESSTEHYGNVAAAGVGGGGSNSYRYQQNQQGQTNQRNQSNQGSQGSRHYSQSSQATQNYNQNQNQNQGSLNYGQSYTRGGSNRYQGGADTSSTSSSSSASSSQSGRGERVNANANANAHRAGDTTQHVGSLPIEEEIPDQDISNLSSRTQFRQSQNNQNRMSQSSSGESATGSAGGSTTRRRMMSQQDGEPLRPELITGVSTLEKAAQGRGGFHAGTLDLGVLNRGNVDDEMRRQSQSDFQSGSTGGGTHVGGGSRGGGASHHTSTSWSSNSGGGGGGGVGGSSSSSISGGAGNGGGGSSSSSWQHSSSTGSRTGGHNGHHSTSHSTGGGMQGGAGHHGVTTQVDGGDNYDEDDYDYSDDDNIQENNSQHSSSTDSGFRLYPRFRRDINDAELEKELNCAVTKCAILRCMAGPLGHDDDAWIALRTRMVASTVDELVLNAPVNISTKTVARVVRVPYIGTPKEQPIKSHEVFSQVFTEPIQKSDGVPLWVVVLAAVAGTLILLLLIYLLYKCGFFKRNRPSDSSERQPLNRNGNYHGDEHL